MRAKDLLFILQATYGATGFTSTDVSETLITFAHSRPNLHLVDNPKGFLTKWISNDLNRLYRMTFLDRERVKRPVEGLIAGYNRGFQYRYWINERGHRYIAVHRQAGFRLTQRPPYFCEMDVFREVEKMLLFEPQKAAERQKLRIAYGWVARVDPSLPLWKQQQLLEEGDQLYRKRLGVSQRYGHRRQIADLSQQKASLEARLFQMTAWINSRGK